MTTRLQLDANVEPLHVVLTRVLPLIDHAVRHARSDDELYFPAVEALAADVSAAFERAIRASVAGCGCG